MIRFLLILAHENQVPTNSMEIEREREREASTNYCLSSITHNVWPVDLVQVNCSPHVKSVLGRWKWQSFCPDLSRHTLQRQWTKKCQYNHNYAFSEGKFTAFSACIEKKNPPN